MTSLTDTSSAKSALAVTPADADLAGGITRGLWVGGTGDLILTFASGAPVTMASVPEGTLLPICVRRVNVGTTATGIVALY